MGLPQGSVREARDRVRSALRNLGWEYPDSRVVFNLAPAEITKSGTGLDLPIAVSLLAASGQISRNHLDRFEFIGELGLFGELRPVQGAVTCALEAQKSGRQVILPYANKSEADLIPGADCLPVRHLGAALDILEHGELEAQPNPPNAAQANLRANPTTDLSAAPSPNTVIGQYAAKRALLLAAAGGHHLLMIGPPGTGKTLLAQNMNFLLPSLTADQIIEVAKVYSAAGITREHYHRPPLRAPHHSATGAALIGGGNPPTPGELALAHEGLLFLDELPHFKPSALNLLREPLESGIAMLARAAYKVEYPCKFQLIAAMNPCPAGRSCREDACRCDAAAKHRYQTRISGPILDRIDMHVAVPEVDPQLLISLKDEQATDWPTLANTVRETRISQKQRQGHLNSALTTHEISEQMENATVDKQFLDRAVKNFQLSARSYQKLWRIARTVADLEKKDAIEQSHMSEALRYRSLDWESGV